MSTVTFLPDTTAFSSRRRNYMLTSHRKDQLIEWMKGMLSHSFVLNATMTYFDTMTYFEDLIEEYRLSCSTDPLGTRSVFSHSRCHKDHTHDILHMITIDDIYHYRARLKQYVPSVSVFHTPLPLRQAFEKYDAKYNITKRRHVPPSFNEIRHILNLAQVMALGKTLEFISFDGDQTLYGKWKASM